MRWARRFVGLAGVVGSLTCFGTGRAAAVIEPAEILMHEDRRDAAPLIRAIVAETEPALVARIAVALGRIGDRVAIEALGRRIAAPEAAIRGAAAFALGEIEDSTAAEILASHLAAGSEPDATVRSRVVEAIGKLGDTSSSASVIAALEDGSGEVRGEAALACWRMKLAAAVPRIAAIARERDLEPRWRATYALARMLGAPTSGRTPSVGAVTLDDGAREEIRGGLLTASEDPDPRIRIMAARGLGVFGSADAREALLRLLRDADWRVRVEAVRGWASGVDPERGVEPVIPILGDLNPNARIAAIEALGRYPASIAAYDALTRMRSDGHPRLRETASLSLAALLAARREGIAPDSTVAIDARLRSLAREAATDSVWQIRASATEILAAAGLADSSLFTSLLEDDPRVAKTAVEPYLRMRSGPAGQGSLALHRMAPDLDRILRSPDPVIRSIALDAAGSILGDSIAKEILPDWISLLRAAWERAEAGDREDDVARTIAPLLERCTEDPGARELAAAIAAGLRATPEKEIADYKEILRWAGQPRGIEIATAGGAVRIALFTADAPITCWNFARLAERGFYDRGAWHRIVPDFVVQDGCPRGDGYGGPGYSIRCEINDRRYEQGSVGMALSGKDTGGSQFFITHSPQPHLDGRYTVFGQVVSGMEIVDLLIQGDPIDSIRVIPL